MARSRTILITGCSSGIGAYCARALKQDGWTVFATARNPTDIEMLQADGFAAFYMDYSKSESISALVKAVLSETGGTLDALLQQWRLRFARRGGRHPDATDCANSSMPCSSAGMN